MAAFDRRSFAGGAADTTISSGISGSDLSIAIADATGWPTGAGGDFIAVIDRGEATEEKVLIASRSTTTLTVDAAGRGYDGTAASAHDADATIAICLSAQDLDEANEHVSDGRAVAHDAAKIGYAGTLDATNVEAALDELDAANPTQGFTLIDMDRASRTAGDLSLNSTSWDDVETTLDLTLTAAAGDILEVEASGYYGAQAVTAYLDVATVVADAPVNYVGAGDGAASLGIAGWASVGASANENSVLTGGAELVLTADDISAGTVKVRLRYRTSSATTKTLQANSNGRFQWMAKVWRAVA